MIAVDVNVDVDFAVVALAGGVNGIAFSLVQTCFQTAKTRIEETNISCLFCLSTTITKTTITTTITTTFLKK